MRRCLVASAVFSPAMWKRSSSRPEEATTVARLEALLADDKVDLRALHALSRARGGFQTHALRARLWPKLLGVNRYAVPDYRRYAVAPHRDDAQIRCDVERSLWNHVENRDWVEPLREKRRKALSDVMVAVLSRNHALHYYQGFHDVCSVFLVVMDDDPVAFAVAEVVADRYLRDFMAKDFEVLSKAMRLIMVLVEVGDRRLHAFLAAANVEPYFATSWLITWWAHDIARLGDVARVYDALLCSHPLFAFYLSAAMVLHLKADILRQECDFAALFNFLAKAPAAKGFDFETLLPLADRLMRMCPPHRLRHAAKGDPEVVAVIERGAIEGFRVPVHLRHRHVPSDRVLLDHMRWAPRGYRHGLGLCLRGTRAAAALPAVRCGWEVTFRLHRRADDAYVAFARSGKKGDGAGGVEEVGDDDGNDDDDDDDDGDDVLREDAEPWWHVWWAWLDDVDDKMHSMETLVKLVGALASVLGLGVLLYTATTGRRDTDTCVVTL